MPESPLNHKNDNFLDFKEKYLVVIASCLPKKVNPEKEPTLNEVIKRYESANVYELRKDKPIPGKIEVVSGKTTIEGGKKFEQKVIVVYGQFYEGKRDYPNDNKQKRLDWFIEALDEIAELSGLEDGVAFPTEICRDGGGNWSLYYQAIRDFAQTLHLKVPNLSVSLYQHPEILPEDKPVTQNQISLLNCDNLIDSVALEDLRMTQLNEVAIQPGRPTLLTPSLLRSHGNKKISWGNSLKLKENKEGKEKEILETIDETNEELETKEVTTDETKTDEIINQRFYPLTALNSDWEMKLSDGILGQAHSSWMPLFDKPKVRKILDQVDELLKPEIVKHGDRVRFLPAYSDIFNAFRLCSFDKLKVVILGQDPYFSNTNEAHGLSFSVQKGVEKPPSLNNIFKEIENCVGGYSIPDHGDLSDWAEQGVLLLNTSLTVLHKQKEAHMKIWREFTDHVIELISEMKNTPVIFMLWGNHAKDKGKLINGKKHLILTAVHPSPLGASRGGWFGTKHFSLANQKLQSVGIESIDWQT